MHADMQARVVISHKKYFFMLSHVFQCESECVYLMSISLCEVTDVVKDG